MTLAAVAMLCACASSATPWQRWATATAAYNAVGARVAVARSPCFSTPDNPEFGPTHPQCLLGDQAFDTAVSVMFVGSACLDDALAALEQGGPANGASANLACAEGALERLLFELSNAEAGQ